MEICEITLPKNKVSKQLQAHTGFNKIHDARLVLESIGEDEFTQGFVKWYQDKYKTKDIPNVNPDNTSEAKKLASDVIDFYYNNHHSVSYTTRDDIYDKSAEFGYTSTLEREQGKEHVATIVLKEFERVNRSNKDIGDNKLEHYLNAARESWLKHIFAITSKQKKKTIVEINNEYKEAIDKTAYIDKLLGGKLKNVSMANIFAVYKELFGSKKTSRLYIQEVLANNRTADVLFQVDEQLEKELYAIEESGDDVKQDSDIANLDTSDEEFDMSISQYNNHTGIYTTFMAHVGQRIKNYFNSLSKLNSPTLGDIDINNTYGIAETMDASACSSMLYNNGIFTNIPTMIQSIKEIGERIKGFEAFVQFAADLKANPDFATEVFTVFAKTKMRKIETVYDDGKVVTRVSNNEADPLYVFRMDLRNDAKTTTRDSYEITLMQTKVKNLRQEVKSIRAFLKTAINDSEDEIIAKQSIENLKSNIVGLIKYYFPSISDKSIIAYIELNENKNNTLDIQLDNCLNLIVDIHGVVNSTEATNFAYNNMLSKAAAAKEHNDNLKKAEKDGQYVDRNDYISLKEVYSDDYVSTQDKNINSLAAKLLPYSIVSTDLNSRNIHGNNNSNIINNSWLTGFKKMLDNNYIDENGNLRNDSLEAWGRRMLKSTQYTYSNLLLEQYDENNNIINKGKAIFRYVNGVLVLTENATRLLKLSLFNGSSNIDNGTNLSYAEMNGEGDYTPTAYCNFFKAKDRDDAGEAFAEYFLRVPSDAPKTFTIRAPRHSTLGLFTIKDKESYDNNVANAVKNFAPVISTNEAIEKYLAPLVNGKDNIQVAKESDIRRILFENNEYYVNNYYALREIPNTKQEDGTYDAYLTINIGDRKNGISQPDCIVLKGTVVPAGKGRKLINYSVEAIFDKRFDSQAEMPSITSEILEGYFSDELLKNDVVVNGTTYNKVDYVVDTNHAVFQMLKNQFKQEMLDAATAIAHYFELEQAKDGSYYVLLENGKPKLKRDNTKGYKFYHLDENGKVVTYGKDSYTLDGKVFHSNKFSLIMEDENGKVIEKNYLDELITHDNIYDADSGTINFLYGRAMKIEMDENGKVTDVEFNDRQNEEINKALSNFIQEYQRQAVEEINKSSEFIHDVSTNNTAIADFAFNQLIMAYTFDEIFEGNTKFYKDSQTILKRAKEVQGSGVPYGIADYSKDFTPNLDDTKNSYLNTGEITEYEMETVRTKSGKVSKRIKRDENGKPITKQTSIQSLFANSEFGEICQRNGFVGVTIKNSTRTNTTALNELVKKLISLGVDESHATDMLFGFPQRDKNGNIKKDKDGNIIRRGGFTETKVNDAQSYITFDEWVRRISARGQLQRYMPLIKKILDRNQTLSAEDIKEFVQVQKNFYYDLYYDTNYNMYVPRQIKNAEFVLVPRFIEGTQLEQVYKAMKEAGIDQLNTVETSKAANEELITLWDNDGNLTQKAIDDFKSKSQETKQIFSYNNLYTQQETPQHMNADNKAGIQIVKKMYDNITEDSPIYYLKQEFFKYYTTNIAESARKLLQEFEIPIDKDGNIILNEKGEIDGLNLKVFLNKLKDEILRRGATSNTLDYVTIEDGNSLPNMPASLMNNVMTMFESVTQSLFNNSITRQTLPGFHAAQVTNIGFKPFAEGKENISYSKELEYHPTQWINKENEKDIISNREYNKLSNEDKAKYKKGDPAPYIEVMLPYSTLGINRNSAHYKGMTDEQILAELAKEGLNEVIGYRIPTEGKQSACVMRIVGFLDDALGSTIVVPDDWVSQTGSDFDIDSVYGITAETYKTKDGQIKRIKFKDELTKYDWYNYIRDLDLKDIDEATKGKIVEAKNKVKEDNAKKEAKLKDREQEAYDKLAKDEKEALILINIKIENEANRRGLTGREKYYFKLKEMSSFLVKTIARNTDEKIINSLNNLKEALDAIANNIETYSENYTEATKKEIDKILEEKLDLYNQIAKDAGMLTLEEYINPDNKYKANSKKARNTAIFENMKEVLQHDESLEENLSRSNFDNITLAKNENMSENDINARKFRSPYNFFHQAKYQEEAMSGAKLKAFSVTLDTFCSICNTVKPTLTTPVYVVYGSSIAENNRNLANRFENYKDNGKTISIRHSQYGWNNDGRTIDNYILTSYSSQTTAFILDNIKEGSIPNVNDYSFAVWKTLANLGIDYNTSVRFIMQPGIARIINAYNANKSVFSSNTGNPIHQAIRSIATDLGIESANSLPITTLLATINKQYGAEFNKIFKQKGDDKITIGLDKKDIKNLPILSEKLTERLKGTGKFKNSSPVENLLFDLGSILIFNNLHNTANEIGSIARCCNPDKFGAKQTVFATRKVFENIDKCIFQTEKVTGIKTKRDAILEVDGKHILAAIYPGCDDIENKLGYSKRIATVNDISKSKYPSLMAFLKYATSTSVIVANTLFDNQSEAFVNLIDELKYRFNGYNIELSEDRYNDFQKYVFSSIYNNCPSIAYPLSVRNNNDKITIDYSSGKDMSLADNYNQSEMLEETKRIYGYEHNADLSVNEYKPILNSDGTPKISQSGKPRTKRVKTEFKVKDINNPKKEEIELFEKLSPAQKIQFIKQNYEDSGIFSFINVSLYNASARGKYAGMQTLEYKEQNVGENVIYAEFRKAFYNKNPLIVSAAIDIVKYAVQVEGLRMSSRAINKLIDNDCLYKEFGSDGLGLVSFIREQIANIDSRKSIWSNPDKREELYENYLRSHKDIPEIKTIFLSKSNINKFGLKKGPYGTYFLKVGNDKKTLDANIKEFNKKLESMGIKTYLSLSEDYKTNKYIRLKDKNNNILYKIKNGGSYIILYPLSNLETNENSQWSANEFNNQDVLSKEGYELLCEDYVQVSSEQDFQHSFIKARMAEYRKSGISSNFRYKNRKDVNKFVPADPTLNVERFAEDGGSFAQLKAIISNHFNQFRTERLFVNNIGLSNYIFSPGIEFGSTQKINIAPNDKRSFRIFIPDFIDRIEKDYLKAETKADPSSIGNESLEQIIKNAQDGNQKYLNNVFEVVEFNESEITDDDMAFASSLEEADLGVVNFAQARANIEGDKTSANFVTRLSNKGIKFNIESLKENKTTVTRELAKYAKDTASYIKENLFDMFAVDPDDPGRHFHILSDRALALTRNSAILQEKLMTAVNVASTFVNEFSFYRDFNVQSEDRDTQRYIEDIKDALDVVSKLPISDVRRRGCELFAEQSHNPLIKEDLIDIFDGFWRTNGYMWAIHDVMENGTPILQIILKNVTADIEAKQKMAGHVIKDFRDKLKEIRDKATRNGRTIDEKKLVKNGMWVQDYKSELTEKVNELQDNLSKAIATDGYGSEAHIKAKIEWDEFKAKHFNQEAAPQYYINKVHNDRIMYEKHPKLYSKYMTLFYERLAIYDYVSKHGFDDEHRKRIAELEKDIYNLYRNDGYMVGTELKPRPTSVSATVTVNDVEIYGKQAAEDLANYINAQKALNNEYFEYDSVYGFQEQLEYNLSIVEDFEQRDRNSHEPTVPQSVLEQNPQYVEARNWLFKNARFAVNTSVDAHGQPTSIGATIQQAFSKLKFAGNGKTKKANQKAREANNGEGIYDTAGIPDARKLSEQDIAEIREDQVKSLYGSLPEGTDRVLISNTSPNTDTFSKAFYSRMKVEGTTNREYMEVVTKLNKILFKYIKSDGIVHLEEVPDTPEGIEELKQLKELYSKLRQLKKTDNPTNGKEVSAHIRENVEFVTNETLFKSQTLEAQNKSDAYKNAWIEMAYETDEDGNYILVDGEYVPNKFLYSYPKPKGNPGEQSYENWVDHELRDAIKLINESFKKVPTNYYYLAKREVMKRAQDAHDESIYQEWYDKNHVYNPYTRKVEPLECWMITDYKPEFFNNNELEAKWMPKSTKREKKIRTGEYSITLNGVTSTVYRAEDDRRNKDYDYKLGLLGNYVKGSQGGIYDSEADLNEEEIEMRNYIQKLLIDTSSVESAKSFFRKNYLPQVSKAEELDKKKLLKEFGKMFGIGVAQNNGDRPFQKEIGYGTDKPPLMPMTKLLENKQTIDYHNQLKELEKNKPTEEQFTNHDEFVAKFEEYTARKNELHEKIRQERNAIRNNDWMTIVESFLEQACRYNAIQENKQKLYFLQNVLKDMKMYSREHGMSGNLKVSAKIENGMDVYEESIDDNLIKEFDNWLRRILFDQWKESEGNMTKLANILQGFTSANYMMLNAKGGFANVTLGETGILAEAKAGEYFGKKEWGLATLAWAQGSVGFARSGYHSMFYNKDVSFNKQDAIIKFFNVVEYDEAQGVVREISLDHYSQKIRDLMFSPQSIGEHFMQNSVLFAMMMSHKIVYDEKGKPTAMSKEEYIEFKQAQELLNILDENQRQEYYEFKENLKKDKNKLKDYAWFRKDALTDFIYLHCNAEQIEKFKKDRKEQRKRFGEDFDAMTSLYDQCELGDDGKMRFVPDSELDKLDREMANNVGKVTQAMALVGEFTMKVKKVNNKIHGVYNRQAAAYIESKWWGSLVMQYHKHLPMGVLKRYMARGHWNETRESVDKGMVQSIADVAKLNLRKIRVEAGLTDEEIGAVEGLVYTITHLFDYFSQLKDTLAIIPNYEKANLLRNLGDAVGVVAALSVTAALWYIADKDEEIEDSLAFNFFLYQADRLASEAWLYNPLGLVNEGKKLLSTPVAAQSIIGDGINTLSSICNWITDDEYDPYYHTGRFAGEHKLSVYIQRRVPMWSAIRGIIDMPSNNHYYKLGANPIGIINVKNLVTED